jgi:HPt (histidine-containing phosphotransfer) domain-containing protein
MPTDTTPPSEATDVLVDAAAIEALAADVGAERLDPVLEAFSTELERRLPILEAAMIANDLALVAREMHSIKGSALTFGASALGAAARRAGDALRAGDTDVALEAVRQVLVLLPATRDAVAMLDASHARGVRP